MPRDYVQELEDRTNRLREWFRNTGDCKVEVWRFHHCLGYFGLRVEELSSERKLHLWCGWCRSIEGPTVWHSPNFEIALSDSEDFKFCLWDAKAGFRVECWAVDMNSESWWFFENVDIMQPPEKLTAEEAAAFKLSNSSYWDEMQHRRIDVDSRHSTPQEVIAFVQEWASRFESVGTSISSYRQASRLFDLRLQAQAAGVRHNLHIVCEGCHYIKSNSLAGNVKIELSVSSSAPFRWLMRDSDSDLLVECDILKLSTDVPFV